MILGKMFAEDSIEISRIQSDLYGQSIRTIFEFAKQKYIQAELTLEIRTDLGKALRQIDGLDHRTLQWLHDAIAGQFRFNCILSEPCITDSYHDLESQWNKFLRMELETIFAENPNMIKHICMAIVFYNPDERGCLAEDNIYRFTLMRYEKLLSKKPTQLDLL